MIGRYRRSRAHVGLKFPFLRSVPSHLYHSTVVAGAMFNLSNKTAQAFKAIQRVAKGMATAAPHIGDTKVPMSLLEKGAYINYQRIEDNLATVRDRCVS